MIDPATWYFFGVVCMVNAPTDCTRIVFDRPMDGNYLLYDKPVQPLPFPSREKCLAAIPAKFALQAPLAVEGSRWVKRDCTEAAP
jgi:hypothetical protein